MTTPYASTWREYHALGWPSMLPLPAGTKWPPPTGYTGYDGRIPSYADMTDWADNGRGGGNIALRLPDDVIGIDVDHYEGKRGGDTLAEAERRWGPLPPAPRSTSRDDGVSGIRLYRVPAGTVLQGEIGFTELGIGDIEVAQFHHRYVVCAPSVHPSGGTYRWLGTDSQEQAPPALESLAALPQAWLDALRDDTAAARGELGAEVTVDLRAALTAGEPSERVSQWLGAALEAIRNPVSSRYDATRDASLTLLRFGKQGDRGVAAALVTLRQVYVAAVAAKRGNGSARMGTRIAEGEFARFVKNAARPLSVPDESGYAAQERAFDELLPNRPKRDAQAVGSEVATPDEKAEHTETAAEPVKPKYEFAPGGSFVLDQPSKVPALWGNPDDGEVLWAEGESMMIAGGQGLGKTTLAGLLIRAQIRGGSVLGLPVSDPGGTILYLAMDRPRQIARAFARQFTPDDRDALDARLLIWQGPPPSDIAQNPQLLTDLADAAGAAVVYIDSVKDAAVGVSEDAVGAGYNRARQLLIASGRQVCDLHHIVKSQGGQEPRDINGIYGSTWLTSGAGSVILLTGEPGDPIVSFRHVKQPATEVGPWRLLHDQASGTMTVEHSVDLVELAAAAGPHGITAKDAAAELFDKVEPSRSDIEKARRKLNRLVDRCLLQCLEGSKGGRRGGTAASYFPALGGSCTAPITAA